MAFTFYNSQSEQQFDAKQYLNRIKVHQPLSADLTTLVALQLAHLKTIPFENLDIHYNRPISFALNDIFHKVVTHGRGGFCYELNSLFHALLQALGFDACMVSARVSKPDGSFTPEFDHLALVVAIGAEKYLVDVGFGRFAIAPLRIQSRIPLSDGVHDFQITQAGNNRLLVNRIEDGTLIPEYCFSLTARDIHEFQPMCEFHQTSPDSHFTHKKVITMLTDDGRITLNDEQLKISQGGEVEVLQFDGGEFEKYLKAYFNVSL